MTASNETFDTDKGVTYEDIEEKNVQVRHIDYRLEQMLVPTGAILPFGGDGDPSGFYICDGREISRSKDRALFGIIGTRFGSGDGRTTFNLPRQDGYTLRGAPTKDKNPQKDPDATSRTAMSTGGAKGKNVGSVQDTAVVQHQHSGSTSPTTVTIPGGVGSPNPNGPIVCVTARIVRDFDTTAEVSSGSTSIGNVSGATTSTENRMANFYVNFIIKR